MASLLKAVHDALLNTRWFKRSRWYNKPKTTPPIVILSLNELYQQRHKELLKGNMKIRMHPKTKTFIKTELKKYASDLHVSKKELRQHMHEKNYKVSEQYHVANVKTKYRAMHVAYSLLRGRTIEQIESKVNDGNKLSLSLLKDYLEQFKQMNLDHDAQNSVDPAFVQNETL